MDNPALTVLARPEMPPAPATARQAWGARAAAVGFGVLLLWPLTGLLARVGGWAWSGGEGAASLASIRVSLELTGWAMLLVVALGTPMALYIRRAGRRERLVWQAALVTSILGALSLAWVRAIGEFAAVVITAYYPAGMPVQLWINLQSFGMAAVMPLLVAFLCAALPVPVLIHVWGRRHA